MNKTLIAVVLTVFLGSSAISLADTSTSTATSGSSKSPSVIRQSITDQEIQLLQQDIRDKRRQIVAANLPLTTEESTKFWPVYDKYIAETIKIGEARYAKIREYAANYASMTDAQAADYFTQLIDSDKAKTDLRVKYWPEFEKVLSKKKAVMFLQIDRRIQLLIDVQRASQVPLIHPK